MPCTVLSAFIHRPRAPRCESTRGRPGSVLGDSLLCWELGSSPSPMTCLFHKVRASACAVSVPPTLEVTQQPPTGSQVNVTCLVKKFYPQRLQLTWLENRNVSRTETASTLMENKDGTFNRTSWLLVNSSAHREAVLLTCQVEHDGQPAVTRNYALEAYVHQKEQDTGGNHGEASGHMTWRLNEIFFQICRVVIHVYNRIL